MRGTPGPDNSVTTTTLSLSKPSLPHNNITYQQQYITTKKRFIHFSLCRHDYLHTAGYRDGRLFS